MKLLVNIILFLLVSTNVLAQDADTKKKWGEAQVMLQNERYADAAKQYDQLLKKVKDNADMWFEAGVANYMLGIDKQGTLKYFENAIKFMGNDTLPDMLFYMGMAKHINYEFNEAIWYMNKFKRLVGPKDALNAEADLVIQMCENGKRLVADKKSWQITNLGPNINSEYPDFRPVLSLDGRILLFTARRLWDDGKNKNQKTPDKNQYFEDIWYSVKGVGDRWEPAKMFEYNQIERNEATVGLSADAEKLLIYMDDNKGNGDLYTAVLDNKKIKDVKMLPDLVNSKGWETHASYSPDGNTIYFTSDRKGGLGGRDIYKTSKLPTGEWGDLLNLQAPINTPYDEEAPFLASDGVTLYFSSNGPNSMGGFDIFYSKKNTDGTWKEPVNMGYPLNTTDDDVFFVLSADGKVGYYASQRQLKQEDRFLMESYGDLDIYKIYFDKSYIESAAILSGMIINTKGVPITESVEIEVIKGSDPDDISYYHPRQLDGGYVALLGPCDNFTVNFYHNGSGKIYSYEQKTECRQGFQQYYKMLMIGDNNKITEVIPDLEAESVRLKVISSPKSLILADVEDLTPLVSSMNTTVVNAQNMFFLNKRPDNIHQFELKDVAPDVAMNTCIAVLDTANKVIGYAAYNNGSKFTADLKNLVPECKKGSDIVVTPVDTVPVDPGTGIEMKIYKKNHKYNKFELNLQEKQFTDFIAGAKKIADSRGFVEIEIESSASKIPTTTFVTNEALAKKRAEEGQERIIEELVKAGVSRDKIRIVSFNALVQGPEYANDYQNTAKYEPFQYVKAKAK